MRQQLILIYPVGATLVDGTFIDNRDYAADVLDNLRRGLDIAIPDTFRVQWYQHPDTRIPSTFPPTESPKALPVVTRIAATPPQPSGLAGYGDVNKQEDAEKVSTLASEEEDAELPGAATDKIFALIEKRPLANPFTTKDLSLVSGYSEPVTRASLSELVRASKIRLIEAGGRGVAGIFGRIDPEPSTAKETRPRCMDDPQPINPGLIGR